MKAYRRLSTAFHPQTDGQTERQNQTLKQYIQAFVGEEQTDWASLLVAAEFAYNRSYNPLLRCSPFELVYGENPELGFEGPKEKRNLFTPEERLKRLVDVSEAHQKHWKKRADDMTKTYNRKHEPMTFKIGDPVMIQTKDLRLKVPKRKLAPLFIGPYRIKDVVGPEAYRLWLPAHHKFHPVLNVSRLEEYRPRDHDNPEYRTDSIEVDGEEQWEIDRLLDRRTKHGTVEYLVRWVGFGDEYNQ